jgi:hypothetical protein
MGTLYRLYESIRESKFLDRWIKNWIHIRSEEAGSRVAAIVSVLETGERLKIRLGAIFARSFRAWLTSRSIGSPSARPPLG